MATVAAVLLAMPEKKEAQDMGGLQQAVAEEVLPWVAPTEVTMMVAELAMAVSKQAIEVTWQGKVADKLGLMETVGHWEAAVAYTPTAQPMSENVGYYPRPSGAR